MKHICGRVFEQGASKNDAQVGTKSLVEHIICSRFLARLAFSLLKLRSCNTFRVENNKNKKKEVCKICKVA